MTKFSVIIPATRAATVTATIRSIQNQTLTHWEMLVVGQGQSESIRSVVDTFAALDSRVCYVHIPLRGLSRARNAGILHSSGEFLFFIDDDCEAEANILAVYENMFSRYPGAGLVGGATIGPKKPFYKVGVICTIQPPEAVFDPAANPHQPPPGWDWGGGNIAVRREVINRVGFFDEYLGAGTEFPGSEDVDYKFRLEDLGIQMATTPRALVHHTYGYRYGVAAVIRHARNYQYGSGGLAGKLTLKGDPRGEIWIKHDTRDCLIGSLRRPYRLASNMHRLRNILTAYRHCLKNYEVREGMLSPKRSDPFN